MSELPRIDSEESLEAWLETRPSEDAVFIAHRAAMRVAPIWCAAMNTAWARKRALTVLTPLRLNLISGVARKYPTPEIGDAPLDALAAAFAAARGAPLDALAPLAAAFAAARAPLDALAAALAATHAAPLDALDMFWDSIQADVHALIEGKDPSEPSLWPDDNPLASEWRESQPILRDAPGGDFWIDWYQRALDGRPQNWPLLRDVALIDDELWKQGGEALDRAIQDRIASYGMRLTEYGEDIVVQPEAGRLLAVPRSDLSPDYLEDVLDKIAEATQILPISKESNAYHALEDEIGLLRNAREKYADRPRMLFSVLSRVQNRIERKIADQTCVEDAYTNDLRGAVAEIRADLLAYSPEVRESVQRHAEIRPASDPPVDAEQTIAVVDAVATTFDNYPRDEMPADARVIADPSVAAEDRKEAGIRTAGRLLRVRAAMLRDGTGLVVGNVSEALILIGALKSGTDAVRLVMIEAMKLLFWLV